MFNQNKTACVVNSSIWEYGHSMSKIKSHIRRRTFTALAAAAMAMVFSTATNAVTYQAMGAFEDGTTWTATAIFQESAMADRVVTINEMDSFVATTQAGVNFLPATYDASESVNPTQQGIVFDGNAAGAIALSALISSRPFYYDGVDTVTGQAFVLLDPLGAATSEFSVQQQQGPFTFARIDFDFVDWIFVPQISSVPEPATASLTAMAGASLLLSLCRRRTA